MKIKINNKEFEFDKHMTVMQACQIAGIEVPSFCYHDKLSIAGNCRICLTQINGRIMPACAMDIADKVEICTDSDEVKRAREDVMQLILQNHPLDCPICDQGGECDLQDQAFIYGKSNVRNVHSRRAVVDKDFGPLLSTDMTRCIHCTRCVRFSNEVGGYNGIIARGTGHHMEIDNPDGYIDFEMSGNLADVCPVGAITHRQYRFVARPWELKSSFGIDVMDSTGSNIRIDTFNNAVVRILPYINESINQCWLSDKARYSLDGLKVQRIDRAYIKGALMHINNNANNNNSNNHSVSIAEHNQDVETSDAQNKQRNAGHHVAVASEEQQRLRPVEYQQAINQVASVLKQYKSNEIAVVTGSMCDMESMFMMQKLVESTGIQYATAQHSGSYVKQNGINAFHSKIAGIDDADALMLIGGKIRWESPIIASRIRSRFLNNMDFKIGYIGEYHDMPFEFDHIGEYFGDIFKIKAHPFGQAFAKAKKPMIIISADVACIEGALESIYAYFSSFNNIVQDDWNGYNLLHSGAADAGGVALDLNTCNLKAIYEKIKTNDIKVLFSLGFDNIPTEIVKNTYVIYQGHHGGDVALTSQIVLPGVAYTEKFASYVNTEGRLQASQQACQPPGDAKHDALIILDIMHAMGHSTDVHDLMEIQNALIDKLQPDQDGYVLKFSPIDCNDKVLQESKNQYDIVLKSNMSSYHLTNVISQHSEYMLKASRFLQGGKK